MALVTGACFAPAVPEQLTCGPGGECPPDSRCDPAVGLCTPADQPLVAALRFVAAPHRAEALVDTAPITVELIDAAGARVPLTGGVFSLAVEPNPARVDLVAPVAGTAKAGLVTFDAAKLDRPGHQVRLTVHMLGAQTTSEAFDVTPTRPSIAVLDARDELSSCATVPYTVTQAQSLPVDLLVEIDPDGPGPEPFRPATQASSAPALAGVQGVPAKAEGARWSFSWDTTADLPARDTSGELRITPSVRGVAGAPSIRPVRVANGARYFPLSGEGSPFLQVDIDHDGWTDYMQTTATGLIGLPGVNLAIPAEPVNAMAVGDFDGNGLLDLAVAQSSGTVISYQRPGFSERFLPVVALTGASPLRTLVSADLDHDGLDELVGVEASSGAVIVLHADRATPGHLVEAARPWIQDGSGELVVADLDHDGWRDLVIGSTSPGGHVTIVRGTSAGWLPPATDSGLGGNVIAVADLDQDGRDDVAALDSQGLHVLTAAGHVDIPDITGQVIALADVDGDRLVDVVSVAGDSVRVHPHTAARGTVAFAAGWQVGTAAGVERLLVHDTDLDGRIDVYAATSTDTTMFLNLSARRCAAGLGGPSHSSAMASLSQPADLNADGKPDLLGFSAGDSTLPARILATWGLGDGKFDPHPVTLLEYPTSAFGAPAPQLHAFDYDGDRALDLAALRDGADALTFLYGDPAHPGRFDRVDLPLDMHPYEFASADLDGDDVDDLVLLDANQVEIRRSDPTGSRTFGTPVTLPMSAALDGAVCNAYCELRIDDLDHDGHPDIVVWSPTHLLFFRADARSPGGFATAIAMQHPKGELLTPANLLPDGRRLLLVRLGNHGEEQQLVGYALSANALALEQAWDGPSDPAGLATGGAAAVDLDGNGLDEVYLNAPQLARLSASPEISLRPFDPAFYVNQPALADLDGDRRPELIDQGTVVKLSAEGIPRLGRLLTHHGSGDPTSWAVPLSLGDFSGDGLLDIAVVDSPDASILLARQSHEHPGELEPDVRALSASAHVALADLNGDAKADAITRGASGSLAFVELEAEAPRAVCTAQPDLWPLAAGDVTADGRADIVASGADAVLLFDAPAFSCTPPQVLFPLGEGRARPRSILLADMNRDGLVDIVVVSDAIRVALQRIDAPGTFVVRDYEYKPEGPFEPSFWSGVLGDLDHNGLPDVVVIGSVYEARVFINSTSAPGTLEASAKVEDSGPPLGMGGYSLALADVQGDGLVDLVVFGGLGAQVFLQEASGPRIFHYAYSVEDAQASGRDGTIEMRDFDSDGRPDLVYTDWTQGAVLIEGE